MLLGTIIFLVIIALVGPLIYVNQAFFMTLVIYLILSSSLNIIYGYTGYLPFGFSVFFAMGAYGFGMGIKFGYGIPFSLLLGPGLSVLLSLVFLPLFRLRGVFFSIGTLGAFEAVYYFMSNSTPVVEHYTGGPLGISLPQVYSPDETYYIAVALLILAILVSYHIRQSKLGLALQAIKNDVLSASVSGVNVSLDRNIAWWITAAFAGMAGSLYGWYISFFYPQAVFDLTFTLFTLVFVIVGGRGTIIGPVLGTIILFSLYYFIGISYPLYFQAAFGILIVLTVLFIPNGLMDIIKKKAGVEVI
jgi:branched-chain amino acid transport system permease protein